MALSKTYTLTKLRSLIRELADQITPSKIQNSTILEIINKNTLDIAEQLNGASAPDYGTTAVVSDGASSFLSTVVQGASYNATTGVVTDTGHGLTSTDIGKRFVIWDDGDPITNIVVTEITGITDVDNFTTRIISGAQNILSPAGDYAVFSAHSAANIDLSSLRVDKIIKLVDSTHGLVVEAKDLAFENLSGIDMYDSSVFYNWFGETLFLFKGADVSAWGTLSLYYYRLPVLLSADGDYVDLRDKYVPLLIDKCKLEVYERGELAPPKELQQSVENKVQAIRELNEAKTAKIMQRGG